MKVTSFNSIVETIWQKLKRNNKFNLKTGY